MPVILKKVQENKEKVIKATRKVKVESKTSMSVNLTAVTKDDAYGKVFAAKPNPALLLRSERKLYSGRKYF